MLDWTVEGPAPPLDPILKASNTPEGWRLLQSPVNQAFMVRCLAGIADVDTSRQNMILLLCRRALHPDRLPLWPADTLLKKRATSRFATRLVECMPAEQGAGLLPTLVTLPWADRIVIDMSQLVFLSRRVAAAVSTTEYRPYMRKLGVPTLWHMVPYLREHNMYDSLQCLLASNRGRALSLGVVTHLIAAGQSLPDLFPAPHPVCLHTQVYSMFIHGLPVWPIAAVASKEPNAAAMITAQWPLLRREAAWVRRRIYLLCIARYSGSARSRFWHRIAGLVHGVQCIIAEYL